MCSFRAFRYAQKVRIVSVSACLSLLYAAVGAAVITVYVFFPELFDLNDAAGGIIISVGYRVKSHRGTQFRQWANKVLKEYLLKGYSINQRLSNLEDRVNCKFLEHEQHLNRIDSKIDFFVRTSLPPVEGVFYDGQIFDAYKFATDLIRSAKKSILLIDNYVNESVLLMLSKRNAGVKADIYTQAVSRQLQLDLQKHSSQYPPISIHVYKKCHDRFLIIDGTDVWHIGASLKDLGKKMFAFSRLDIPATAITALL